MAAYWHIAVPFSIRFKDKSENLAIYQQKFSRDFKFEKLSEYEKESPPMPDGSVITWKVIDRHFALDEQIINDELKAMFIDMATEWIKQYKTKAIGKFHSNWFEELYNDFEKQFLDFPLHNLTAETITKIKSLSANYFIHFDSIAKFTVYEGFPVASDEFSFNIVSLLHSAEKMNMIGAETAALHNFTQHFKEKYHQKYRLAKYLFICGY